MKQISIFSVCVTALLVGSVDAQQPSDNNADPENELQELVELLLTAGIYGSGIGGVHMDTLFAKTEGWRNGFRVDGRNPLGTFTRISGTTQVMFRECGSPETTVLPEDNVRKTDQTCLSIPGISPPSVTASAPVHWKFIPEKEGFHLKTVAQFGQPFAETVISCKDLPAALLAVAEDSQNPDLAIAGDRNALVRAGADPEKSKIVPLHHSPSLDICGKTSEFWTTTTQAGYDNKNILKMIIIGVSNNNPENNY